jgi:hypothetical protein
MTKFVICLQRRDYKSSLKLRKLYQVLPDDDAASDGELRVFDEFGEDYLYPENWFAPIELPQAVEDALLAAA